jgi:DNA repair protein RadC
LYCDDVIIISFSKVLGADLESSEKAAGERESELVSEREEAAAKLRQLVETHELLQSEMASVQSDLATANSLANTHKLTAEKVSSRGLYSYDEV